MIIRAMTYNICSGLNMARARDLRAQADVILKAAPDVVVLNEVRMGASDAGGAMQAEELGAMTGMNWAFGRSIDIFGGEYGNALLTRHGILSSEVINIPDPPAGERAAHFEHRTIFKNVLDISGRRITVLGSHYGLSPAEQKNAAEKTARVVDSEKNPVIFMGDLNMEPGNPTLNPVYQRLCDAARALPRPLTFPSDEPKMKIDYIFFSREFTVNFHIVPDTRASDHRPILAELSLT